jgi:hypothetical protein
MIRCPLCYGDSLGPIEQQAAGYFLCLTCQLRFLDPTLRLTPESERARYLHHNNDVMDPAYQRFVEPLAQEVHHRVPKGARGLDFGAGTGPVLAQRLKQLGYAVELYDLYFHPDQTPLSVEYDFICASEVVEHMYDPGFEFRRFKRMLKPGGLLGLMTLLFSPAIDFQEWYYRRDPTHVVFYSQETFQWIRHHFGFSDVDIVSERLICLRN